MKPSSPTKSSMQQGIEKMSRGDVHQFDDSKLEDDQREQVNKDVHRNMQSGFSNMARLGMLPSMRNSHVSHWASSVAKVSASSGAKKMKESARLKSLHRTPYPMVLSRMKLLLDRLQVLKHVGLQSARSEFGIHHGVSIKSRISLAETAFTESSNFLEDVSNFETVDDGNGSKLSLEKILEELGTTFSYVSEFLRKVPEETRIASILYVKMENFKKDQTVYRIGEESDKFYIILTGGVEVWTHPPGQWRQKTVIATLRKGQSFGDRGILNNEPRMQCVTASGNCTFLTVERDKFEEIFGSYFQARLQQAHDFFLNNVEMLAKIPKEDVMGVVRHMLLSTFHPGKEWDPLNEQQIYFITQGTASLESHDRKFPMVNVSRAMLGLQDDEDDALTLAETGDLANVVLRQGRAVGTLGHEEEMRKLRRQLIPKKAIATLDAGLYFGGGKEIMGDGELQSSLRVLATTEIEVYHCHIQTFFKYASPEIIRALRNDMAFKLTYYYGRIGCLAPYQIVGHPESDLGAQWAAPPTDDYGLPQQGGMHGQGGGKSPGRKRKVQKHVHEPGRYAPEVEKAIKYIESLQAHFELVKSGGADCPSGARGRTGGSGRGGEAIPIPGHMQFLVSKGCTPAERFWAMPAVSATARSNAIAPLLGQVFPEGLAPLASKLDELVLRSMRNAARQTSRPGTQGSYSGASPFGAMEGGGQADLPAEEARLQKLRALAQSPLENVNRSMLEGKSNQQEEQDRSTGRMAPAGASSGQGSPRAPSPAELRMGSSKEAGPGPGSVSSGRGAFSREGGFSFPALEGDGGALVQREHGKEGSERGERAFGHPSRGSGAWLDEALGRTPSSPRAAGAAGTPFSQSMHQQHGSSQSDTQPPRSSLRQRGFLAEEGLGDSRGGARGAGGAGSGAGRLRMATTSGSNATVSYNALLDSKARKRGALMASGVVWARNQELNPAPSLRQCLTFEEIARLRAHQRSGENAGGLISSLSSRPSTAPAL